MAQEMALRHALSSAKLDQDEKDELIEAFVQVDINNNQQVEFTELVQCFQKASLPLAKYQLKQALVEQFNCSQNTVESQTWDITQFARIWKFFKTEKLRRITAKTTDISGVCHRVTGRGGAHHAINHGEVRSFTCFINQHLKNDEDLANLKIIKIPVDGVDNSRALFGAMENGVLLCKLVNLCAPDTISEKAINKNPRNIDQIFRKNENLKLAINSAESIGVVTVGHTPLVWNKAASQTDGKSDYMILGMIWQLLRKIAFKSLNLADKPKLFQLLRPGETLDDLSALSPEELLLRWVNYHLNGASDNGEYDGVPIKNFGPDVKNGKAYIQLLNRVQPEGDGEMGRNGPNAFDDHMNGAGFSDKERAEAIKRMAEVLQCGEYITPQDILEGNEKVNVLFAAQLFNEHDGLQIDQDKLKKIREEVKEEQINESADDKTYRNFINSMEEVRRPKKNPNSKTQKKHPNIHSGFYLTNLTHNIAESGGVIILQLEDIIKKGCVDWKSVNPTSTYKLVGQGTFKKLENCNLAVKVAAMDKSYPPVRDAEAHLDMIKVTAIDGNNIKNKNRTLTLAIVWQLMRAYSLKVLQESKFVTAKQVRDGKANGVMVTWAKTKIAQLRQHKAAMGDNEYHGPQHSLEAWKDLKDDCLRDSSLILEICEAIPTMYVEKTGQQGQGATSPVDWADWVDASLLDGEERMQALMENAKYALACCRKIDAKVYAIPDHIVTKHWKMISTIFACLMSLDVALGTAVMPEDN